MLAARLRARCPSARVIGRAEATGFHLTFDKIGQDGSGKATLVPGDGVVPGVLFDLAAEDVHLLDRIEGVGDLRNGWPGWPPNPPSPILNLAARAGSRPWRCWPVNPRGLQPGRACAICRKRRATRHRMTMPGRPRKGAHCISISIGLAFRPRRGAPRWRWGISTGSIAAIAR